jgi:tetratricopeptide (TPR) repeat protein/tRNA A-37 threonylcarbamoyl transferase component Bud32
VSGDQFPGIEALTGRAAGRVEQACLRFEDLWLGGARPRIEEFLQDVGGMERRVLACELILLDLYFRRQGGDQPRPEEYRDRFPEHADQISAAFAAAPPVAAAHGEMEKNGKPFSPWSPQVGADRNLLFGILALQLEFISKEALIAGLHAWVLAKHKSLGQILREHGALERGDHAVLEAVVRKHLQRHDDDPLRSMAGLPTPKEVRQELSGIADEDVQATVDRMVPTPEGDPDATDCEPPSAGAGAAGLRYRILRAHDEGGLGKVSVAHDEELHREVALKEIRERYADDPHLRRRFVQEGEITGALEHPGIVPVYGLGRHADGRPYYAMRFIRGESLKQAVERFHKADVPGRDPGERNLALRQLLSQFVVVCKTIGFAHDRGIIHRDLKPANIMLGKYGETLVVDWGLAKAVGRPESGRDGSEFTVRPSQGAGVEPTAGGAVIGSPPYMSPEQAAGRVDQMGPASDIFGLGATLYAVLTGLAPYGGNDPGEVVEKARKGAFPAPRRVKPGLARGLEAICLKAMAFQPGARYPQALDLGADIETWLADEPVKVYREPVLVRLQRWRQRHRGLVAGLAAAVLVVLVGAGAFGWYFQQEQARQGADRARRNQEKALRLARVEGDAAAALRQATGLATKALALTDQPPRWKSTLAEARNALGLAQTLLAKERDAASLVLWQRLRRLQARLAADERDRVLVARVEEIRLEGSQLDEKAERLQGRKEIYPKLRAALTAYGLPVGRLAPEAAAARLRGRPKVVLPHLLGALYFAWSHAPRRPTKSLRWLEAVTRAADGDPWRKRVLWALAREPGRLNQLVREKAVDRQPAAFLVALEASFPRGAAGSKLALLRRARHAHSGDFWVNYSLAWALIESQPPQFREAVRYYTVAEGLRPGNPAVNNNLGLALKAQNDLRGAVRAFRRAINANPKYAKAYFNLGLTLYSQKDLGGAEEAFRRAIKINPRNAQAHYALGNTLYDQKDLGGAVQEYRRALKINPQDSEAYNNLGNALKAQKDLAGAERAYLRATQSNPKNALAFHNLGNALYLQQDLGGAERAYRRALKINPRFAMAHINLGLCFHTQARFAQALASLEKGHKFLPPSDTRFAQLRQIIRRCRRLAQLEDKLPAVLSGQEQLQSAPEQLEYARLCALKRLSVAAARFCERAFAADPKLAEDLQTGDRYNAALCAALAGCGQGKDADKLDDQLKGRWRKQALTWLRADLDLLGKQLGEETPQIRATVQRMLRHWQQDPDLAGLRDPKALAKLSEAERKNWNKLWADVAALVKKAREPK